MVSLALTRGTANRWTLSIILTSLIAAITLINLITLKILIIIITLETAKGS